MSLIILRLIKFAHALKESLLNSSVHFSVPCNSQILCCAICATNLLTVAMDVDEPDSALEEAGAETDLAQTRKMSY